MIDTETSRTTEDLTIQQKNIAIAIFMGYTPKQVTTLFAKKKQTVYVHPHNRFTLSEEDFNGNRECFNNSWNWLMPVVERIEELSFKTEIKTEMSGHHCTFIYDNPLVPFVRAEAIKITGYSMHNKISAVYDAVYKFAKKYSKNHDDAISG